MHMPVTIHFPNYAFSEHIHMSYFQKWNVFLIKPFSYGRHKNLRVGLPWVLANKETFASTIFSEICYVACAINCTSKLICLHACLHECNCVCLIDKPVKALDSQSKGPKFKTTRCLQGQLSLSFFQVWSFEYQELLGTEWQKVKCLLIVAL